MLPPNALFIAASDSAAGCLKASLPPERHLAIALLPADDLLGARLGLLDDLASFVRDRVSGTATFFEADLAHTWSDRDFSDEAEATTQAFLDRLQTDTPTYIAAGSTAADFTFFAYSLALHQVKMPGHPLEARNVHVLDPALITWPDLGATEPSAAFASLAAWQPVSPEMLDGALVYWRAISTADLPGLNTLLTDPRVHPRVFEAAKAFAAHFPDADTGLSYWDLAILEMIAAEPMNLGRLIAMLRYTPTHPAPANFMHLLRRLQHLAGGSEALIAMDGPVGFVPPHPDVRITRFGAAVLNGTSSAFAHLNQDYWVGGFHVTPSTAHRLSRRQGQVDTLGRVPRLVGRP